MLFYDSTKLANAIHRTQLLVGHDVLSTPYDSTVEAEAIGCKLAWDSEYSQPRLASHVFASQREPNCSVEIEKNDRVPVTLEVVHRLSSLLQKTSPIFTTVTGPATLAKYLTGKTLPELFRDDSTAFLKFAGDTALKLTRLFCEAGAFGVALIEPSLEKMPSDSFNIYRDTLDPILRVLEFYQRKSIFAVENTAMSVEEIAEIGCDAVVISGLDRNEFSAAKRTLVEKGKCFGVALPATLFENPSLLPSYLPNGSETSADLFVTTQSAVPTHVLPTSLKQVAALLRVRT